MNKELKKVRWVGCSRKDLLELPKEVCDEIGHGLYIAQQGKWISSIKTLKGFKGAHTFEIIEDYHGDTYRAVYTVKFGDFIYVLHVFQKKSKSGISTPKQEMDLINQRLKIAEQDFKIRSS